MTTPKRETPWTPGPWEVHARDDMVHSSVEEKLEPCWTHTINMPSPPFLLGATGAAVCAGYDFEGAPVRDGRAEANAHLIAAAPALAEALEAMVATHGMHGPCRQNSCRSCDRAYKKARAALRAARGES